MSQTLCHYPAMVSKEAEAPPWLPWKLFKSEGAKIRMRFPAKRRPVKSQCPFMNAYLVESVSKRTDMRLKPIFPLQERSNRRPVKPVVSRAATHVRVRSSMCADPVVRNSRNGGEEVRRSWHCRRARSELGQVQGWRGGGRRSEEAYGLADISKWSNDGESPRSVGLSHIDSSLI